MLSNQTTRVPPVTTLRIQTTNGLALIMTRFEKRVTIQTTEIAGVLRVSTLIMLPSRITSALSEKMLPTTSKGATTVLTMMSSGLAATMPLKGSSRMSCGLE